MIEIEFTEGPEEFLGKRKIYKNTIKSGSNGEIFFPDDLKLKLSVIKQNLQIESLEQDISFKTNGKISKTPSVLNKKDLLQFDSFTIKICDFKKEPKNIYEQELHKEGQKIKKNPSLAKLIQKLSSKIDL